MKAAPNIVLISSLNSNSFWLHSQAYVVFNLTCLTTLFDKLDVIDSPINNHFKYPKKY